MHLLNEPFRLNNLGSRHFCGSLKNCVPFLQDKNNEKLFKDSLEELKQFEHVLHIKKFPFSKQIAVVEKNGLKVIAPADRSYFYQELFLFYQKNHQKNITSSLLRSIIFYFQLTLFVKVFENISSYKKEFIEKLTQLFNEGMPIVFYYLVMTYQKSTVALFFEETVFRVFDQLRKKDPLDEKGAIISEELNYDLISKNKSYLHLLLFFEEFASQEMLGITLEEQLKYFETHMTSKEEVNFFLETKASGNLAFALLHYHQERVTADTFYQFPFSAIRLYFRLNQSFSCIKKIGKHSHDLKAQLPLITFENKAALDIFLLSDELIQEEQLLQFENKMINISRYIDSSGFHFSAYQLKTENSQIRVFDRERNAQIFYRRLLRFYLAYIKQNNFNEELFREIGHYFRCQLHQPLKRQEALGWKEITEVSVEITPQNFQAHYEEMQKFLYFINFNLRSPERIHEKFMHVHKPLSHEKPSEKLYGLINNNQSINISGYSARSVIIALHAFAKKEDFDKPKKIIFGKTEIHLKRVRNYGVFYMAVQNAGGFDQLTYDTKLTTKLIEIEKRLLKSEMVENNLMKEIIERFSKKISPFLKEQEPRLLVEEINLLNGFAFLSQILEVARYLPTSSQRSIEKIPMSIALAIVKQLRIENKKIWQDLYAITPTHFSATQEVKYYNPAIGHSASDPLKNALGGFDPASGHNLKKNQPAVEEKIKMLDKLYPGYLSEITSARSLERWLKDRYGSENESLEEDSEYSSDEDTYKQNRLEILKEKIKNSSFGFQVKKEESLYPNFKKQKESRLNHFFQIVTMNYNKMKSCSNGAFVIMEKVISHMLSCWHIYAPYTIPEADIEEEINNPIIQATAEVLQMNIRVEDEWGETLNFLVDAAETIILTYKEGVFKGK
jgi:hypothetical protein